MSSPSPTLAYDIQSAVLASGIGRTKLYEAMKTGRLKARKFGRKIIILHEDLKAFIDNLPAKNNDEEESA